MQAKKHTIDCLRDERGNVLPIFALMSVIAVTAVGGAIDFGKAYQARARLQSAADAGATAGASMASTSTSSQRSAMALSFFNGNLVNTDQSGVVPTATVNSTAMTATINVAVASSTTPAFLKLIGINSLPISATSTAVSTFTSTDSSGAKICLLALDPNNENGIHLQGNQTVNYPNCWAQTNSTQSTAINSTDASATETGAGHCAVGNYSDAHNDFSPTPTARCSTVADPFATVSAYASSGTYTPTFTPPQIPTTCTATNLNLKKGTFALTTGNYCGGISISAGAKVTLAAGVYIMNNGTFNVQSGASVSGSDVLIYFTSDAASTMTIIGGGTINLKGRLSTSTYAGYLFIAAPGTSTTQVTNIQGGGTMNMEGILYMPFQTVYVTGNGTVNASTKIFGMVARNFLFQGTGTFNLATLQSGATVPDILPTMQTVPNTTNVSLQ